MYYDRLSVPENIAYSVAYCITYRLFQCDLFQHPREFALLRVFSDGASARHAVGSLWAPPFSNHLSRQAEWAMNMQQAI